MAAPVKKISVATEFPLKITKWKIRKGQQVSKGNICFLYSAEGTDIGKFKVSHDGIVSQLCAKEGQQLQPGEILFTVEGCSHPTVMKDMCADCGADLRLENSTAGNRKEDVTASVAMVHSIPELIVSEELAQELGQEDEKRLLKSRKLALLVDLDQTLIHTTNDNIPPNLKDVHHFQLWHGKQLLWYHTRLRPYTQHFLENVSKCFELHICTFGVRMYAHTIAKILDPDGKYFSHRILSRDECFNASSKTANLKALFPCGDGMVCIIDDREDVWNFSQNLVHVKPYRFFQGTADINAPPGLTKTEQDDKPVVHKVRRVSQSSTESTESTGRKMETETIDNGKVKGSEDGESVRKGDTIEVTDMGEDNKNLSKNDKNVTDSSKDSRVDEICDKNVEDKESSNSSGDQAAEDSIKAKDVNNEEVSKFITGKEAMKTDAGDKQLSDDDLFGEIDDIDMDEDEEEDECDKEVKDNDGREIEELDHEKEITPEKEGIKMEEIKDSSENTEKSEENKSADHLEKNTNEETAETADKCLENKAEKDISMVQSEKSMKGSEKSETENDDGEVKENEIIEWDDEDDYLLHLEEILTNIHKAFYDMHDQMKAKEVDSKKATKHKANADEQKPQNEQEQKPNNKKDKQNDSEVPPSLKNIIPYIKKKVLKGVNIVFSGIIPTNMQREKHRAFIIAKSLGANVQQELVTKRNERDKSKFTTHLVAARHGTLKVRTAWKCRKVKVVNVDWLWACSERWEKAEESLFPLTGEASASERCSPDISKMTRKDNRKRKREKEDVEGARKKSKQNVDGEEEEDMDESIDAEAGGDIEEDTDLLGNGQDRFPVAYNPLLAFSDDDLAYMDKEVDDEIGSDEGESSEEEDDRDERLRKQVLKANADLEASSSEDSMTGDLPRGWGLQRKLSPKSSSSSEASSPAQLGPEYESETDQDKFEKIMEAFGPDTENSDNESIGSVDDEIAEAVVKEFLS